MDGTTKRTIDKTNAPNFIIVASVRLALVIYAAKKAAPRQAGPIAPNSVWKSY
jgi:hypothetical protein